MERELEEAFTIFNELRLEGQLCDVVIKVNGTEFNAHKIILCGCSPYFRALFTSGDPEKRVYNIPGVSPDMMRLIVEYAYTYTLSVPVTQENVEEMLTAADQLNVTGVVQTCRDFLGLRAQLCPENSLIKTKMTVK